MTLLVSWAAVDTHGTSSIYIATESRLRWSEGHTFDSGRKVFAFSRWPDVLGYCGDVLFPSIALNQIVALADAGLLFRPEFSSKEKFQAIVNKLNDLAAGYPAVGAGLAARRLTVVHGSRDPVHKNKFSCHSISLTLEGRWRGDDMPMPAQSSVLFALGSGAQEFRENYLRYDAGPTRGTSRAVFHCFCDVLSHSSDVTIGGPPQLVGVIRKPGTSGLNYGVVYEGKRTFLGMHVDNARNFSAVEWRNPLFERCDGETMTVLARGQRQPDPLARP